MRLLQLTDIFSAANSLTVLYWSVLCQSKYSKNFWE